MIEQSYGLYTPADQAVWSILYKRQIHAVETFSYDQFGRGLTALGFDNAMIPDFRVMNESLSKLTGWLVYAVPGLIPGRAFFEQMALRRFGATTWLRKMSELDYLEEPDMFHDVFGHVPLLTDRRICDYLHKMAHMATRYRDNEAVLEQISRLYWFTVEFGLVKENGRLKIYGAGILSSPGETAYCMSAEATLVEFDLEKVIHTAYRIDNFQQQYFVLDTIGQLQTIAAELDEWLATAYG